MKISPKLERALSLGEMYEIAGYIFAVTHVTYIPDHPFKPDIEIKLRMVGKGPMKKFQKKLWASIPEALKGKQ